MLDASATPRLKFSILGDSVTQCPGIAYDEKLRAQLKAALQAGGYDVTLRNHSIGGTSSAAGLTNVDWVLSHKPDVVLLSLGANDSFDRNNNNVEAIERNLGEVIEKLRAANVVVLLAGMRIRHGFQWRYMWRMYVKFLVNSLLEAFGKRPLFHANSIQYARKFNSLYRRVAEKHHVPLYPYLFEGVRRNMWQDMYHLNGRGVRTVVDRLAPFIFENIKGVYKESTAGRAAASTNVSAQSIRLQGTQ